jgi:hypothetical protein
VQVRRFAVIPALLLCAVAFSACGGGGSTPAPPSGAATPAPTTGASASPTSAPAANPAAAEPILVTLGGGSLTETATASGAPAITLPASGSDGAITLTSATFGANNATSSFTLMAALANGIGQVTPAANLPPLPAGSGTVIAYLQATMSIGVIFTDTPQIVLTDSAGFPASTCGFWVWHYFQPLTPGQPGFWVQVTSGHATAGDVLTLPAAPPPVENVQFFANVPDYIAVTCP